MSIFQKWLAILSIPLAFEIVFVIVLLILVNQEDAEVMQQIRSQIVKTTVERVVSAGDECAFLLVEYGFTKEPDTIDEFILVRNNTLEWINGLESTIDKSETNQVDALRRLREAWLDFGNILDNVKNWTSKRTSPEMQVLSLMSIKEKIGDGNAAIHDLYSYRKALDEEISQRHRDTRLLLHIWLAVGVLANIVFVIYMIVFCRDITRRVNALKENSLRLANGQELNEAKGGTDEIAEFDAVFYDVATALQDSFDRERANFDGAADAICALDSTGSITRANEAFQGMLGFPTSDILQSDFAEFIVSDDHDHLKKVMENVSQVRGQRQEVEVGMLAASGKRRDFVWSIVWEHEHQLFMCVGQDITAYKRLEHAKQEFVAMLSHDLRSPLSSIGTTFELVENGAYGPINERMSAMVARALQSVRRLISLIGELLDLEKIEAGEMELNLAITPVATIMDQAINAVSASAENNKLVLKSMQTDLTMNADEDRIVRVLINLLSNAIKYSPPGGLISVDVREGDEGVVVSVTDQGQGISEDHLEKIFERYKQVSRYDHSVKRGSGLGLSICKAIVEAHGGVIGVKSEIGKGSTFWFRVP
ncbi:MAG: ATP-binding protein [Candidatus Melainabacteria bacterium]|nr:ATP-binding protein [Candidatus Melainabacteria bacterium]